MATPLFNHGCGTPVTPDAAGPGNFIVNGNGNNDTDDDGTNSDGSDVGGGTTGGQNGGSGRSTSIIADKTMLDFGSSATNLPLALSVRGVDALAYTTVSSSDWLNGDPAVGTLTAEPTEIVIRVDRTRLPLGPQTSILTFVAIGVEPVVVQISATGSNDHDDGRPPELYVSAAALEFGSGATQMAFSVQNVGGGDLDYTIATEASWILVSPSGGRSSGEADHVSVAIDRDGLASGQYDGTVVVRGGGSEKTISIHMFVSTIGVPEGDAELWISRSLIDFGSSIPQDSFIVQNRGHGSLAYTVTSQVAWAAASVTNGVSAGEEDRIDVSVSRAGLAAGVHTGALLVAADNGQLFAISLRVSVVAEEAVEQPVLAVSQSALDFSDTLTALSFDIHNAGGGTLRYTISSSVPWMGTSTPQGECTTETDNIVVVVDRSSLAFGLHSAALTVSSAHGASQQIEVSVNKIDPYSMENFPFFQYVVSGDEMPLLNEANRNVLLRPVVSNFWFNPTYLNEERNWYRQNVPGAQLGRYFVPFNATPAPIPGSLPNKMSNIPDEWLLRNTSGGYFIISYGSESRYTLDLTLPEVRAAQVNFWIQNSQGWDTLLIDHFFYKYTNQFNSVAPGVNAWWAAMKSLAQEYSAASNKPIYINAITRPEETWVELAPHVDGFFYESALGASAYFDQANWRKYYLDAELRAYRAVLDMGKYVLITNNKAWAGVSNDLELSQPTVMGPLLSAAVCLTRNPGDPLYYNTNILRGGDFTPYGFHNWWRELGTPLGAFYWDALVCKRDFSKGRVEFDVTTAQPVVRVILNNGVTYSNR